MRYGSVCSGIEIATVAWEPLGWQAEFYSEIEPFPCHVLHRHYSSGRPAFMPDPDQPGLKPKDRASRIAAIKAVTSLPERANGVPNHGDMTKFEEWPDHAIDLLVGGTPCQSYSVAGLRKGLADPRGDGPQYKGYGNAMSANVMRWLGERINTVDQIEYREAAA